MFNFEKLFDSAKKLANRKEKFSVEEIYQKYIAGEISQPELFATLDPGDIESFIKHHHLTKEKLASSDDRKITFKLNQLDNAIERGLEKPVREAHGEIVTKVWKPPQD
ncbi:MAG: hypothetical protein HY456_01530 [Parcubacteria group bacterium]|nr:hypothetical protein [Parcubacteria group bacterium]